MKLAMMSSPQIQDAASRTVALLPIAAIEQHGPHLAVSTDDALVTTVAERAESQMADDLILCPTLPFGSSHHHFAFPGTLSISHETYIRVLVDLVESLLHSGFRRIVLLNGHGGNITPGKQALAMLSHKHDDELRPNIALTTYWELAGEVFQGAPPMETPALSHACEYETSLMLHLHPERVDLAKAARQNRPQSNGYIGWEDDEPYRGVSMSKRTHFVSSTGASGRSDLATAAKGEHLLNAAVAALVEFLEQFKTWPLMEDLR
jgi:creatinine amidohydrolase